MWETDQPDLHLPQNHLPSSTRMTWQARDTSAGHRVATATSARNRAPDRDLCRPKSSVGVRPRDLIHTSAILLGRDGDGLETAPCLTGGNQCPLDFSGYASAWHESCRAGCDELGVTWDELFLVHPQCLRDTQQST